METAKQRLKRLRAQGKAGGLIGGPARSLKLSAKRRYEIAKLGAMARWNRAQMSNKAL